MDRRDFAKAIATAGVADVRPEDSLLRIDGRRASAVVNVANRIANVLDFGARGDGLHDDTNALATAIAFSQANGVAVSIPPGRFKYTSPLELVDQASGAVARIEGAGRNVTTLAPVGEMSAALSATGIAYGASAAKGVVLRGVSIDASGLKGDGLHIKRVGLWSRFENLRIVGATGRGIFLNTVYDHTYENIEVRNCGGVGIDIYESQFRDSEGFQECSLLRFLDVHVIANNSGGLQWRIFGGDAYRLIECKPSEGNPGIAFYGLPERPSLGHIIRGMHLDGPQGKDNVGVSIGEHCENIEIDGIETWNVTYSVDVVGGANISVFGVTQVPGSPAGRNTYGVRLQRGVRGRVNVVGVSTVLDLSAAKSPVTQPVVRTSPLASGARGPSPHGSYSGGHHFSRGVRLADGRVFLCPCDARAATIYDPCLDASQNAGGEWPGAGAIQSAVILHDGRVFSVPKYVDCARIYDPHTDSVVVPHGKYEGNQPFSDGVVMRDGRVLLIPYNSLAAAIYDPETDRLTYLREEFSGEGGFSGGVLLKDDRVYMVPSNSARARVYDPFRDEMSVPTGGFSVNSAFSGGVLLPDGRVFCCPSDATEAQIYDPDADSLRGAVGEFPGGRAFSQAVLLRDGRVFCVPWNARTALIYDPIEDSVVCPPGSYPGEGAFASGVLLDDGRVLMVPGSSVNAAIAQTAVRGLNLSIGW